MVRGGTALTPNFASVTVLLNYEKQLFENGVRDRGCNGLELNGPKLASVFQYVLPYEIETLLM